MALVEGTSIDRQFPTEEKTERTAAATLCDRKEAEDVVEEANPATETPREEKREVYGFGVWTLGEPFADQAKVAAALDTLGPFVMETLACPLPLLESGKELFDDSDASGGEATSMDVRGLQELQLNDVVDPVAVDDASDSKTTSDEESIEEVSDRVFASRDVEEEGDVDQRRWKRKRTEFGAQDRSNFVKHNLRNKRRKMRNKSKFPKKSKGRAPLLKPVRRETIVEQT